MIKCDICNNELDYFDNENNISFSKIKIERFQKGFVCHGINNGFCDEEGKKIKVVKNICGDCIYDIENNFFNEYLNFKAIKNENKKLKKENIELKKDMIRKYNLGIFFISICYFSLIILLFLYFIK